jgi:putative ABC transport system substrate-binding protein
LTYSAHFGALMKETAAYVGKVLDGSKPGALPVVFPTRFDLTINLKTAKALGLQIPLTLLRRADEVIE